MRKKGISLIILIITLVLIVILLSITMAGIGNAVGNSRLATFGDDLSKIEDAIEVYYAQNGELPKLSEDIYSYSSSSCSLTSTDGKSISINKNYKDEFEQELNQNLDKSEGNNIVTDSVFYTLDLEKIDVKKTKRGKDKNENNNINDNIYVIAYPSLNVYYLKGVVASGKIYFSLANISDVKKISNNTEEVETQTMAGVTVTREKRAWTNTLGINITANLSSEGEKLYIKVPVRDNEIKVQTQVGENSIKIKSLDTGLELSNNEVNKFFQLDQSQKNINVIKKVNGIEVANIKVSLANYDNKAPSFPLKNDGITKDFKIESFEGYNKLSFTGNEDLSGIREVRYVYTSKFGRNANVQTLISNIENLTTEYMLKNGMKGYVSNNNVEIKLPKDIKSIYMVMFDKAGNNVSTEADVQLDVYIGISPLSITDKVKLNIAIKSNKEIKSATANISMDNKNYIDSKELSLKNNGNGIYNAIVDFENSKDKIIYVKVDAYDNSTTQKKETRIKKIDLANFASTIISEVIPGQIYEENRYYTDINGDRVIVPTGFTVSTKSDEQVIDDGLVIADANGNEFVWIPVDGTNVKYEKWNGSKNTPYSVTKEQVKDDDKLPNGIKSETDQITKYHGFYVARYEAGLPDEQTTSTLMETKTFSADDNNKTDIGKPQSKPNKIVWNFIDYSTAKAVSEAFISNEYVQSGLITGTQWDTMLKFLAQEVNVDTDCTSWGNYSDKYGYTINGYYYIQTEHPVWSILYNKGEHTKSSRECLLLSTGKFASVINNSNPKNIYDVAGNVWEWSAETVTEKGGIYTTVGNGVIRGGSFYDYGNTNVASYRSGGAPFETYRPSIGFRFVLYIK